MAKKKQSEERKTEAVLAGLGIVGMESIEPVILAALIGGEPLLLIGPHGTGKSYLLNRVSAALGLEWRHYNASLLNYDDLVGYPLPDGNGGLDYIQTPASIWGAEAVFIDEISRCRPDLQNKLFPIIHERRVQGLPLEKLVYRWSAMNPPSMENDDDDPGYHGSEPLDPALADRFAFVVEMPAWSRFSTRQQENVILSLPDDRVSSSGSAGKLLSLVDEGRSLLPAVREEMSPQLASYTRMVTSLLLQAGIETSPRRAAMLLRNIIAVHTARTINDIDADIAGSAYLALENSLPHPAMGEKLNRSKVLASHREAWKLAGLKRGDPRRIVYMIKDPLVRALRAAQTSKLGRTELSTIVADSLASLPPGGRHALAAALFDSGTAGRLVAAVAEQCAELYALAATPQDLNETVRSRSGRHALWQHIVGEVAKLKASAPDTPLVSNLIAGLFGKGEIHSYTDFDRAWNSWHKARKKVKELTG